MTQETGERQLYFVISNGNVLKKTNVCTFTVHLEPGQRTLHVPNRKTKAEGLTCQEAGAETQVPKTAAINNSRVLQR